MISDFNLIITTQRGNERAAANEIYYLLKEQLSDDEAQTSKTKIRGLVVAKTSQNPFAAIQKLRQILKERPYEFRYALRIVPIEKVVKTTLEDIKAASAELAKKISPSETFRVTVEKRYTTLHSKDLIEAAAGELKQKAEMEKPDKIIQIEVLGALTGIIVLQPSDIISVVKEKML